MVHIGDSQSLTLSDERRVTNAQDVSHVNIERDKLEAGDISIDHHEGKHEREREQLRPGEGQMITHDDRVEAAAVVRLLQVRHVAPHERIDSLHFGIAIVNAILFGHNVSILIGISAENTRLNVIPE